MKTPTISLNETPLFPLGALYATPGALQTLHQQQIEPSTLLLRHSQGDWGELDAHDRLENQLALEQGYRLLSSYRLQESEKIWIITEADRSATTILLPSEY